jgi:hypothetical protein
MQGHLAHTKPSSGRAWAAQLLHLQCIPICVDSKLLHCETVVHLTSFAGVGIHVLLRLLDQSNLCQAVHVSPNLFPTCM